MKKIALYLFMMPLFANAQDIVLPTDSSGAVLFTEVINIDSTSKDDLYSRAKEWFSKTFISSKYVIQNDDRIGGIISGKAKIPFFMKVLGSSNQIGNIHYTISVYLKDGRYKYELSQWEFLPDGYSYRNAYSINNIPAKGTEKKVWIQSKEMANSEAISLTNSLKESMKKTLADW